MSQQEPADYELEFHGDAPFWAQAGDASRRTFLMPLANPAAFLAFGVVGPSNTLLFVARGRVREHLGEFIGRMDRAGASVELYVRPPLPAHIVKRYSSDEPYESYETEGPKNPPVNGIAAYGGGADTESRTLTTSLCGAGLSWPVVEGATTRKAIVMPFNGGTEFLAFGVCTAPDRFVFVGRGTVAEHRAAFIAQMTQAGVSVESRDWPSEPFLQRYLEENLSRLVSGASLAPGSMLAGPGSAA